MLTSNAKGLSLCSFGEHLWAYALSFLSSLLAKNLLQKLAHDIEWFRATHPKLSFCVQNLSSVTLSDHNKNFQVLEFGSHHICELGRNVVELRSK